ncbi:MAG: Flp family type IVb pilin [Firmicutes bacterium]|nr:Flp family type IVb pilin [Bacillota bacterium]
MLKLATRFVKDEDGQGLAEYGLILALIAVAVIGVLALMGDQLEAIFGKITGQLEDPSGVS